jgi:hypothetical protein
VLSDEEKIYTKKPISKKMLPNLSDKNERPKSCQQTKRKKVK